MVCGFTYLLGRYLSFATSIGLFWEFFLSLFGLRGISRLSFARQIDFIRILKRMSKGYLRAWLWGLIIFVYKHAYRRLWALSCIVTVVLSAQDYQWATALNDVANMAIVFGIAHTFKIFQISGKTR